MENTYNKYVYNGPVMFFDKCVANNWKGETSAPSMNKAKSNLVYQIKKQMNLLPGAKVTLPGKVKIVH